MADYAAKPTKAKEDMNIIDLRKRMLGVFLNRCRRMKEVREDGVWWRFLDPNASWVRVELVARDMWTHHFAERSPTLVPTRNHTQEQHESATAGPCSPYSCPSVASSPIRIGEVTIKLCNLIEWYPYLATQSLHLRLFCRTFHTWSASFWSFPSNVPESFRTRLRPVFCQLRILNP
jgi:hypothetical protein